MAIQKPPTPFLQAAGHLYFIGSGLWLWGRWQLRHLFGLGQPDAAKELESLAQRFRTYLRFLEKWGILTLEFHGFEEAQTWRSCLVAANHPSILDAVLLMSRIPMLNCVANARLLSNPVMSGAAMLCDFVRNDSPLGMIKSCRERLKAGFNILIFPEGTRTKTPPLGPFFRSYVLAATQAGVPIRTILIESDSDYFGRGFYFFRPATGPVHFKVTAGRVFEADRQPSELSVEIESYFRGALARP